MACIEICFTIEGKRHCWCIPEIIIPIHFDPHPVPPSNYEAFLQDATIVASIRAASHLVSDSAVKERLMQGLREAITAMEKHAGPGIDIRYEGGSMQQQ
ncbi:hypothetical protein [Paraburkholderia sabiae]|uniref:hypothetical protein n=1 Tax=Paraburkholderia sabiae TaxID=273251 RepID=UPI001CC35A41|nr:hypothetical protein [Paraburkholderia sabiae]